MRSARTPEDYGVFARRLRARYALRVRIIGLDHVQLAMPRGAEAEARRFYAGVLGLEEEERPEPQRARGGAWFRGGRVHVHLGVEDEFRAARKAHAAFLVEDLDACRADLSAAGCEIVAADGPVARFHAFDPFGNRLEFIRDGEGFSQR